MYEILSIVAVLVVLLGVVFVWKLRKNNWKHEPDYRTMFNIGIIWVMFGVIMNFSAFFFLGIAFLIAGLIHRKEWKEGVL